MNARRAKQWWWLGGLLLAGLVMLALGRFLASRGLEDADRWASVLGLLLNAAALPLTVYTIISGHRSRPQGTVRNSITGANISGPVVMGRDMQRVSLSGTPIALPDDPDTADRAPATSSDGSADMESRVEGGTVGGPLIMGRDLRDVVVPPSSAPALPTLGCDGTRRSVTAIDPPLSGVSNQIKGGVFFDAVIQGRDIQVMLPAEVTPALTGLPPESVVFPGRDDPIGALREALRPGQAAGIQVVSAVAGLAGIGKTELVLHVAHQALRDGWFPGGVLFVDMFGYDPERRQSAADALAGWLSAIGVPSEHIPAGVQNRSRLWRSVLDAYAAQDRRLSLIIDNVSSEDQVTPLLPADGRVPVLVTSRHTLDLDARLHYLGVLDPDPAVALITEVIAGRRGSGDPRLVPGGRAALSDLAALCGGLPLALRIVAALLADRPLLQPAALAGRLRVEQVRLDGLSREQVAVRAAFDLSYQHLTVAQACLFRLLAVNPGPDIATAAVTALTDVSHEQVTVLLEDLHRAHLVNEPAMDRWRMHDLIRLHAAEQTPDTSDETDRARQRLCGYYQDTARAADTHLQPSVSTGCSPFLDRSDALNWFDAEHANLIAVAIRAPTHGLPSATLDLAGSLAAYLHYRCHFSDWITITSLAGDIAQQGGDRSRVGDAWNNLGNALHSLDRFDEAIDALKDARDIARESGDLRREGQAWNNLGNALAGARRFAAAIATLERARDIHRRIGDQHGEGAAWCNLGTTLAEVRRFAEAVTALEHARDIYQRVGDRHRRGPVLNNLGIVLRQVGRLDEAIIAHTEDLQIRQQVGDVHGEGQALGGLGTVLRLQRRFRGAVPALERARDIYRQTGDRRGEGMALNNLGNALRQAGRLEEAIVAHTEDLEMCRTVGNLHGEGGAWNNLGLARGGLQQFEEALAAHTRARDIFQQTSDRNGEGHAYLGLGYALANTLRFDEARDSWERALSALTETDDADSAAQVRVWLDKLPPASGTR